MKSLIRQVDRRAQAHDAGDWEQAELALRREPRDLVLCEMTQGDRHGAAVELLERRPEAVIALLSEDRDTAVASMLLQAGVRGVIPHDLDWRAIVRALDLVLLGGYYIPAHALRLNQPRAISMNTLEAAERMLPYRRRMIDPTALSPRQQQIIRLVHMGSTNKGIARALGISEGTVKIHLATAFKMLGANNRAAAVAIYNGWLFDQSSGTRAPASVAGMIGATNVNSTASHESIANVYGRNVRQLTTLPTLEQVAALPNLLAQMHPDATADVTPVRPVRRAKETAVRNGPASTAEGAPMAASTPPSRLPPSPWACLIPASVAVPAPVHLAVDPFSPLTPRVKDERHRITGPFVPRQRPGSV